MHLDNDSLRTIAGLLGLSGFVPYIWTTLSGKTTPARTSWLIWGALNFLTLLAMAAKGADYRQLACVTIGSWIVAFLGLIKKGDPRWHAIEKICVVAAVVAVILWKAVFHDSTAGLIASLIAILIGCISTWQKAWREPKGENLTAWVVFCASSLLATVAVKEWTIAEAAQPVVFLANQIATVSIILFRRRRTPF